MQLKIGNSAGRVELMEPVARSQQPPVVPLPLKMLQTTRPEPIEHERPMALAPAALEERQKGPAAGDRRPSASILERELDELARGGDARRFGDRVYERARQILEEAYESAAELRLEALSRVREQMSASERAGSDLRTRAAEEANTLRAQGQAEAALALQRAQREADAVVANARATAQRISEGSHAESDAIQKRAQREAQEVHDAAARALSEARARVQEIAQIESEFEQNARAIAKWLGLEIEPERNIFKAIKGGKK